VEYDWRSVRDAYEAIAPEYAARFDDEFVASDFDRAVVDETLDHFDADDTVLDAGSGPGQVARHLGRRGVRAIAMDLSPGLMQSATHDRRCSLVTADILSIPFRTGSLHGIIAWFSVHNLPRARLPHALSEFRRVLRLRGALLIATHAGTDEDLVSPTGADDPSVFVTYYEPDELISRVEEARFA
jgi:ubiquinone/menaquinone biosynthesis C-methylase UbiE